MPPGPFRLQAQVALHLLAGLAEAPAAHPHKQVHPGSAATQVVLAAALVAEPGATPVPVVIAVAVPPAAGRAGLVAVAELLGVQPPKHLKDVPPAARGRRHHVACHGCRRGLTTISSCRQHWPWHGHAGQLCCDSGIDHLAQHRRATECAMGAALVKPSQLRLGDGDAQGRRKRSHKCLEF